MASSTHKQQQPPIMYAATAAPPPTPTTQPINHISTSAAAADVLSSILLRLPPTLSLPSRRSPLSTSTPPLASISYKNPNLATVLSSTTQLGCFQITDHDFLSELAHSAESESLDLFQLTTEQKQTYYPKNYFTGCDHSENDAGSEVESFCFDDTSAIESTELSLSSLAEFTRALEKVGLKVVEMIASAVGIENPIGKDPTRFRTLMCVSEGLPGSNLKPVTTSGGYYPYVVGLEYQTRNRTYLLSTDAGRVSVSPQVDSIFVTLGDNAQVWSNGKLKKVSKKKMACLGERDEITMSLFVTLSIDDDKDVSINRTIINMDDNEKENEKKEGD